MKETNPAAKDLGLTLAMLLLRIWLGARAIVTGIEKFVGTKETATLVEIDGESNPYGLVELTITKSYGFENYKGVPEALYKTFVNEPLIPLWGLNIYNAILGPALIFFGITILIGLATRISLFAMGLIYASLTFGLILLKQDAGIAWLGVHIILVVMGLSLAKYNTLSILKKW